MSETLVRQDVGQANILHGLVRLAASGFNLPYALICLFHGRERTVIAYNGPPWLESMPDMLFSISRTLGGPGLVIHDVRQDPWAAHSPAVRGKPGICFYAGAPMIVNGDAVGVFCVLDHKPSTTFGDKEMNWLQELARMAAEALSPAALSLPPPERTLSEESHSISWMLPFFNLPLIDLDDKTPPELRAMQIFQLVMDTSPQAVYWKDRSSTYLWCNRYFAEDTGIGIPENIYGKTDDDLSPNQEEAEYNRKIDRQVIESGKPVLRVVEPRTLPGERLAWLEVNRVPVFDIDGNIVGILGTYQDITERKEAEGALRSSKQVLQIVFDNIPQRIFWKDYNSVLIGGNRGFAQDAGLEKQEDLVGKTDYDMPWSREQADAFVRDDREVIESNVPRYHIIEPMTRADGKTYWLDTNKVPLHDGEGNVVGMIGTYEDITKRKEAEDALKRAYDELEIRIQQRTNELSQANEQLKQEILDRQRAEAELLISRERYALAVNAGQVGIWEWNMRDHALYLDPSLITILRLDLLENPPSQETVLSVIHPDDRSALVDYWQEILKGERPTYEMECRTRSEHSNQEQRWVLVRGSVIKDADQVAYRVSGSITDITALKEVEQALRRRDQILDALTYASQELLSPEGLETLLPNVLAQLSGAIGYERAYIYKNDPKGASRVNLYAAWPAAKETLLFPPAIEFEQSGIKHWRKSLEAGSPVSEGKLNPNGSRQIFDQINAQSLVWIPIFCERAWWGLLGFDSANPERQCIPAEIEALKTAASTLGAAFAQQRIRDAEREQRNLAEALSDIAALLNSTLNLDRVLDRILSEIGRVVPHDSATITLTDKDSAWQVRSHDSDSTIQEDVAAQPYIDQMPTLRLMVRSKQPVIISDTRRSDLWINRPHLEWVRSYLGAPIQLEGEVIGFIHLNSARVGFFSSTHAGRLEAFTDQAAIAIQNARLYEQAQALAALEERQRLARDLHDAVSQTLWTASITADVLPELWKKDQQEGERSLEGLRRLTQGALAEMRTLLLELRPAALIEARLDDLLNQLAQATMSRKKLSITIDADERCTLPTGVQVGIYRIAQETLNNIAKHSRATEVRMQLEATPEGVRLSIQDNGHGFDIENIQPERLGLHIMRERAAGIGADLNVSSIVGQGTTVVVEWPCCELNGYRKELV
jgi:PAS domain S-box-containing protein